jgi:hypothetical protein
MIKSQFIGWNVVVVFFYLKIKLGLWCLMPLSTILQHTSYKALYYNVLWGCCDRTVVGFTTTYDMYAENMLMV